MQYDPKRIYDPLKKTLGGKPIDDGLMKMIAEEAKTLEHFIIWDIFVNVSKKDAIETMVHQSKSWEDMKTGKAMLAAVKNLQTLVFLFKNMK